MFGLSVCLVLFSSFFIMSFLKEKMSFKNNIDFIIFILLSFSQIILTFEVLSLFKKISVSSVIIINLIFFFLSLGLWKISNKKSKINIQDEFIKIKRAIKQDRLLYLLTICFVFSLVITCISALILPVKYGDALTYYLTRCTMWIQNASFSHYLTTDSRELIMPINSEILYTWILLFLKNEKGIGVFSFIFYLNLIWVLYNFLGELGFCRRKRLWAVFLSSSLALVNIESSIAGSDLIIGSLILTSIYLFYYALKYKTFSIVFFSGLSYALAIGIKTTALIAFPTGLLVMLLLSIRYSKKYLGGFLLFLIINFVIFSSYNYILNYIDFANPFTNNEQFLLNQFRDGFKGYIANLIRYAFLIFDFSGMPDILHFGILIEAIQEKLLNLFYIDNSVNTSLYFGKIFHYNSILSVSKSALGILGLFVFYPALLYSGLCLFKKKKSHKTFVLGILAFSYIINILIFARTMVFTPFNVRYILTFVIISLPVIIFSYIKKNPNLYKIIVCFLVFYYLLYIPMIRLIKTLPIGEYTEEERIRNYFLSKQVSNIGIMISSVDNPIYYIEKLRLSNIKLNSIMPEIIEKYDLAEFDYIISNKDKVNSTLIYKNNKSCLYFNSKGEVVSPKNQPAMVVCPIFDEIIYASGFENCGDIELDNYVIFKNVKK